MGIRTVVRGMRAVAGLFGDVEAEANARGAVEIAPEHLVLAALRDPDGSGARALEAAGGSPAGFREALAEAHASSLAGIGIEVPDMPVPEVTGTVDPKHGRHRLTPGATRLFRRVAEERAVRADGAVLGAQVMLALSGEPSGAAVRALGLMGVSRDALAEAARAEIAGAG